MKIQHQFPECVKYVYALTDKIFITLTFLNITYLSHTAQHLNNSVFTAFPELHLSNKNILLEYME